MRRPIVSRWRRCAAAAVGALALAGAAAQAGAQVTLRDGSRIETALDATAAGVRVRTPQGAERIVGWDRVRRVEGALAAKAEAFMPLAEQAWRARSRLARGDAALASPLFEQLFEALKGEVGATPLLAAEGALACRLARGDLALAVEAHLRVAALRAAGARLPADTWLGRADVAPPAVVDADTGLAPALSPLLLLPGSRFAQDVWVLTERLPGDAPLLLTWRLVSGAMSGLATQAQLEPLRTALDAPYDNAGDALLRDAALAIAGAPAQRTAAQRNLSQRLASPDGDWTEAWRRLALGRSLSLEEGDVDALRRGAIELLHLPARFGEALPRLSAVAVALAANDLRQTGDEAGAQALRDTLARLPASAEALAWLDGRLRSGRGDSDHAPSPLGSMLVEPVGPRMRRLSIEPLDHAPQGACS